MWLMAHVNCTRHGSRGDPGPEGMRAVCALLPGKVAQPDFGWGQVCGEGTWAHMQFLDKKSADDPSLRLGKIA